MENVAPYLKAFQGRADGTEHSWLLAHRNAAMKRFSELGFPTRKQEAWRFTDLRPLTGGPILPAGGGSGLEPVELASSFLEAYPPPCTGERALPGRLVQPGRTAGRRLFVLHR